MLAQEKLKMRTIIFLLLLSSLVVYGQIDETFPRSLQKPNSRGYLEGQVTFTRSMYGFEFEGNVKREYQEKIKRFMCSSHFSDYSSLGKYTLRLALKHGNIYLVEDEHPNRLILLE
jgi:hypothetical protein